MLGYTKTILCLANSYKTSGRCIAGLERLPDGTLTWVRPVSSREHGEVSEQERMYPDGRDPRLRDVIEVPLLGAAPHGFQIENHLLDPDRHWTLKAQIEPNKISEYVDRTIRPLWRDDGSSSQGVNDRVREALTRPEDGSLRLIEVEDLNVRVAPEESPFGSKRKVRGGFTYAGQSYLLGVTDPEIRRHLLAKADANHRIGRAILCVSLGEVFEGHAYKLIAAIITP